MKKYVCALIAALQSILLINTVVDASSTFMAKKGDQVLTGRNGDSKNLNIIMHVLPPSFGKHGRIFLGAEDKRGFYYTTGMNDHGLWYGSTSLYDGVALPQRHDIKNYYNKPTWPYELTVKVMEECTTVREAMEIYSLYFTPYWNGHTMFVDKNGNSVIVEFGENDVVFIRGGKHYQVMTNFPNSDTLNARWYNCYRNNTAESILANSGEISTDLFRSICEAVHQEGSSPTSLSTVYDMINGDLFIYYFHNFKELLKFNLTEELQKGERYYRLAEYYNQVSLIYPIKGEQVSASSVTFVWNGNAENYQLFYSNDKNLKDEEFIDISTHHASRESTVIFSVCWFGAWPFVVLWIRKKNVRLCVIGLTSLTLFLSCGIEIVDLPVKSPFAPSTIEHRQTIENLPPNTFYYWKIVAKRPDGINSESISETFNTLD